MTEPLIVLRQFRRRLPNRHLSETIKFKPVHMGGHSLHLMTGFYVDAWEAEDPVLVASKKLGELFVAGPLNGSDADSVRKEWATLLSMALQWGMPLKDYAENMQRDPQGRPLTVLGEIVDELMKGAKP